MTAYASHASIVLYTTVLGAADHLTPAPVTSDVRCVCLTDRDDVDAPGWEIERFGPYGDPRQRARMFKMSPFELFPNAAATIWMDASFDLLVDPFAIASMAVRIGTPIVAFAHPDRTRVRQEAAAVIAAELAPAAAVNQQIEAYRSAGFDSDRAPQRVLTTTGLLVRWQTHLVYTFNNAWRHELLTHTLRDQLSVDYAAWRTGVAIGHLPGHYRDNAYVRYCRDRHRAHRVPA